MTAGLGRGLALAGIGAAVGLAVVAALFGTGDLLKRGQGPSAPGNAARPAAGLPPDGAAGSGTEPPRRDTGDRAAIDPNAGSLAGPDGASQGKTWQAVAPAPPSLDILRVEPTGEAVLAGRGAPKASVELLRDNTPVARATADESGQFAMDGLVLPPGNSELTLRSTAPDGRTTDGKASAVVVVDKDKKAQPLVAVSEADKPTRVLSMPQATEAKTAEAASGTGKDAARTTSKTAKANGNPAPPGGAAAETPPRREAALPSAAGRSAAPAGESAPVRIVSVDAQEGGRLFVSGQGAAWTSLRLYLNDTMVASGRSGADGRVSFTIGRGVKPGGYQIRIDQVDDASGKVGQRAQVGFTFPAQLAAREPAKEPVRTASRQAPASPAKPEPQQAHPAEPPASPAARPGTATPPAPDMRTAEAARASGAGQPQGADANASAPALPAPGGAGPNAPADPSSSPGRAAEPLPSRPGGSDMAASSPTGQGPAAVFVPEIDTTRITRGDNLWQISRKSYGDGKRYTVIYEANREQIRDPNLIYPGQIFVMPKDAGPAGDGQGAKRG